MDHRIGRWLFLQNHCLISKQVELNIIVVSIIALQLSCQKEKNVYCTRKCQVRPNKCQIKLNCLQELLGSLSKTLSNYDLYTCLSLRSWKQGSPHLHGFLHIQPGNFWKEFYPLHPWICSEHASLCTNAAGLLAGGGGSRVVLLRHKKCWITPSLDVPMILISQEQISGT